MNALLHDLRNRLNSITMSAELAKLELGPGLAGESAAQCLDAILAACSDSAALIEQISVLSANEAQDSRE